MHAEGVDIDAGLARQLIAAQFPEWADLPVRPVEGGWDNRTFRLGEDMTVRLPSAERYAAQVAKEQQWLPRLALNLPLAIPVPLAMGAPACGFPWRWSVHRWIDGEPATPGGIGDLRRFATALGGFLGSLHRVDPAGGPAPGAHNFFRGAPPAIYDAETRRALACLGRAIDAAAAARVWDAALESTWRQAPVWVHGDVSASNLLVVDGRLRAVIDFGCCGVGDPACDLAIAWTFFSGESRESFRAALPLDDATWARGRGWALWKALITLADAIGADQPVAGRAARTIDEVLADHALHAG